MKYNFATSGSRKNQFSMAVDSYAEKGKADGLVPAWIADMGIATAPEIVEALKKRIDLGIYGYTYLLDDYYKAIINWSKRIHNYCVEQTEIVTAPTVVSAIHILIDALTNPGDGVLVQTPTYPPFCNAIESQGRKVVDSPLVLKDEHYEIDWVDFENKLLQSRLFIFASPHNPTGRVYTKDELKEIIKLCKKHNVLIVEDAIHNDVVYKPNQFLYLQQVDSTWANENVAVAISPTKTFNLASLQVSNIIIKNETLRKKYLESKNKFGYPNESLVGIVACITAYNEAQEWYKQFLQHLQTNLAKLKTAAAKTFPKAKLIEPQGTFLSWWDVRDYNMGGDEVLKYLENNYNFWVYDGQWFGENGKGFIRVNFAQTSEVIDKLVNKLTDANN